MGGLHKAVNRYSRSYCCACSCESEFVMIEYQKKNALEFRGVDIVKVNFYENVEDNLLKFAVIISKHNGKWVFCKHKERNTYEIPGGHREPNEEILETAKRELYEETGAVIYVIKPVCVYSVVGKNRVNQTGKETYGMLYFADIQSFESELHSEMECVCFFDDLPTEWTYPLIQPLLIEEYLSREGTK